MSRRSASPRKRAAAASNEAPGLSVIVVAAGRSTRMGFDKTFALLDGKGVVAHSIAAFENCAMVREIIVVGRRSTLGALRDVVRRNRFRKVSQIIAGGARRQDSVRRGLRALGGSVEHVAVHDAARPLVRPALIERVFAVARAAGGAACAGPVCDTLKRVDRNLAVTGGVERDQLFAVQTPQIFQRALLVCAYDAVFKKERTITDEISAVEMLRGKVVLVPNDEPNFKITYPSDLELAELILRERARVGRASG